MAKQAHYFRQSTKSISNSQDGKNFAQIMRSDGWHVRIWNKVRGKGAATS